MKWPWISREAHDALLAEKDARIQREVERGQEYRALLTVAQRQIDDLTRPKPERIAPAPLTLEPREPSYLAQTIRELAQGDTRLAAYLHQEKRRIKSEHPRMSDEGVAQLLCKWQTSEDVLDSEAEA